MSVNFSLEPQDEKPKKVNARKERSSKYQPILDAFLESKHKLVRVDSTGKEPNYLAMILNKLVKKKEIRNVNVFVRNRVVYLENVE